MQPQNRGKTGGVELLLPVFPFNHLLTVMRVEEGFQQVRSYYYTVFRFPTTDIS